MAVMQFAWFSWINNVELM